MNLNGIEGKKALVLASGGIDSTVCLYLCAKVCEKVECITFNYGARLNEMEHRCLRRTCAKLGVKLVEIDLGFFGRYFKSALLGNEEVPDGEATEEGVKKTVVPFRNGIMLSIAAGYAESNGLDVVVIGNHAGEHAMPPDCSDGFIASMDAAVVFGTDGKVRIDQPFGDSLKGELVREGFNLGVDFKNTYSCYKGGEHHCGNCSTCHDRKDAFL